MAQSKHYKPRKIVMYKGQRAWLYENGLILNAKTARVMRGGARLTNEGGVPIEVQQPEVLERIRHALSIDCNVQETCIYAGVHAQTLQKIFSRNPEFSLECAQLKMAVPMAARSTVAKGVVLDPKIALSYLKLKRNKEFSERSEVDSTQSQPVGQVTRNVLSAEATHEIVDQVMNGNK